MSKITRNERLLEQIIHASLDKPRISHMLARLRTIKTYQNVVLSVELAAAWEAGWCNAARTIVNAFGTSDTAVTESLTIQPSVPYGCSHSSISPDDSNLGYVSTVEVRSDIHAPSPTTFMDDVSIEDGLVSPLFLFKSRFIARMLILRLSQILRRSVRQVYGTCHEHDKQTTITNQ